MEHNSKPVPIKRKRLLPDDTYRGKKQSNGTSQRQRRQNKRNQYTK